VTSITTINIQAQPSPSLWTEVVAPPAGNLLADDGGTLLADDGVTPLTSD